MWRYSGFGQAQAGSSTGQIESLFKVLVVGKYLAVMEKHKNSFLVRVLRLVLPTFARLRPRNVVQVK